MRYLGKKLTVKKPPLNTSFLNLNFDRYSCVNYKSIVYLTIYEQSLKKNNFQFVLKQNPLFQL